MMRRLFLLLVAALASAAALVTAAGAATAAPAVPVAAAHHGTPVRILADCRHARYEPSQVIVACGDGNTFFKHLTYEQWNARHATGRGTLWVNTCTPDCAAGHYVHRAVTFVMDRPQRVDHELRYSRIVVRYVHPRHHHDRDVLFPPTRAIS